jgi:hypothetical protein
MFHFKNSVLLIVVATLITLVGTSTTYADPVNITTGFFRENRFGQFSFNFSGSNLQASGSGAEEAAVFPCPSCRPGQTIDLNTVIAGDPLRSSTATYNGIFAPSLAGVFRFSGSLTLPSDFFVGERTFVAPFTFGELLLGLSSASPSAPTVFSASMTGQGTAYIHLEGFNFTGNDPFYSFQRSEFIFNDPQAVPEPVTILLFGTGLAAFAAQAHRRKSKTSLDERDVTNK